MENSKIRITNTKYSLNSLTEGIELYELPTAFVYEDDNSTLNKD